MFETQLTEANEPTIKLWNPKFFLALELIFSFLPVGILSALNYGRCGYLNKKWNALYKSFVGVVALVGLFIILPFDEFKYFGYGLNICIGTYFYYTQQEFYNYHIQNGVQSASYLIPTLLSSALAILIAIYIFFGVSISFMFNKSINYDKSTLHYTNNVSSSEAASFGKTLNSDIFCTLFSDSGTEANLDKQGNTIILSIVVTPKQLNDPTFCNVIENYCDYYANVTYRGSFKVKINLCDSHFKTLKSINSRTPDQFLQ